MKVVADLFAAPFIESAFSSSKTDIQHKGLH